MDIVIDVAWAWKLHFVSSFHSNWIAYCQQMNPCVIYVTLNYAVNRTLGR